VFFSSFSSLLTASHSLDRYKHNCCLFSLIMLAVVDAVVRVKKGASCMTVWDFFHVLLGRSFVSGLRTKKTKNL